MLNLHAKHFNPARATLFILIQLTCTRSKNFDYGMTTSEYRRIGEFERSIDDMRAVTACGSGHCACELTTLADTCSKRTIENYALEEYCFLANQWLALNEGDGQLFKDLLPTTETGKATVIAKPTPYTVRLKTKSSLRGGTNADLFLTLVGEKSESGEFYLQRSNSQRKIITNDAEEVFSVFARNLGRLKSIRLRQENDGTESTWDIEEVNVCEETLGFPQEYCFCCRPSPPLRNESLGLVREFPVSNKNDNSTLKPGEIPYEFKIFNGISNDAATSWRISVELTNREGRKTSRAILPRTVLRGEAEPVYVHLEDIGAFLKSLIIGYDRQGRSTSWHLERVEVKRLSPGDKNPPIYRFYCGRWLTGNEMGKPVETELFLAGSFPDLSREPGHSLQLGLVRPEQPPVSRKKSVYTYEVTVVTGDSSPKNVNAAIFLSLIDESGRFVERKLEKSETNRKKFESGKADIFVFEDVDLVHISEVRLRQDKSEKTRNWFLDRIEVRGIRSKDGTLPPDIGTRVFKCNKLFSKAENTISLTLEPNPPEKTHITSLLGDNSRFPEADFRLPHVSMDSQIALGSHRPYSADTDALADTKLPTVFCRGHAAHQSIRHVQYRITMRAGNWGRAGARGPVTVNILGTNGTSTGPLLLETLANNTALEADSEKTFVYRAPRVPFPTEIEIRNLEAGRTKSSLFLRNVRLEILDSGTVYDVSCNAWIAGQDATEGTSTCRFPLEYAAINVHPKASSAVNSTSLPEKKEPAVGIPYRLDVWSDTVIYQSPTVSVEIQVFGDRGSSEVILLRQSSWVLASDERASVHFRGADVGVVKSVRLELIKTISAVDKPDARISRACLLKTETHEALELSFTQWHTNNFVNLQHQWADLLASEPTKALTATKKYLVRVKTSSLSPETMTANAYIRLYGEDGDTGDLALRAHATNPETFKSGQESKFSFSALSDLGDLMRCTLWHDNAGASPDWHCEWVRVSEVLPPISGLLPREWFFDCNRWISAKQGNNECCVELKSSTSTIVDPLSARTPGEEVVKEMKAAKALREEACEESCESFDTIYRIHVETTNTEGADCDHTGWIMLKGEFGHSAPFYLIHPKGERTFQRGGSDDFVMFSPSLGLLKKLYVGITNYGITLSLDNPNDPSQQQQKDLQWHCKRILVTDEKNSNVYVFNINQWIMVHPDVGKHAGFGAKPAELRTGPMDSRERNRNDAFNNFVDY
ncbi:Lipoxygenase y domain-containing protein 1 [Sparganum proliferum]